LSPTSPALATAQDQPERFGFGENWSKYLAQVDERRIALARASLQKMLAADDLTGKSFIDIGSGSGLFSLAARQLGARVFSFDFDINSVKCAQVLKSRFFPEDPDWKAEQGSVLDGAYLSRLGTFDVVYSWGVLHHTGEMWIALANVVPLVKDGGKLFVAIYNDQGGWSRRWKAIKRAYVSLPRGLKWLVVWPCFGAIWGPRLLKDLLTLRPFRSWSEYRDRGMSPWRDLIDWVGGYPFEVAKPEEIFDFYKQRGFKLVKMTTQGAAMGCNEFVFEKIAN
jgi:2-polyprenyl-3-methyl-5-hydroxy-6-metoxy-1,4-benzoquinol methylase